MADVNSEQTMKEAALSLPTPKGERESHVSQAFSALSAYSALVHQEGDDEPVEQVAKDLLVSLGHLCDELGVDFESLTSSALVRLNVERKEFLET